MLWLLLACSTPCDDRPDDRDCDGVPDGFDRCPQTPEGSLSDRRGCSENQAAGCSVRLLEALDDHYRWEGDCAVYLLQFSDDPAFHPARVRTAHSGPEREVVAEASEGWWRVVGGLEGRSAGFSTEPLERAP